jgi:hypothetical protein
LLNLWFSKSAGCGYAFSKSIQFIPYNLKLFIGLSRRRISGYVKSQLHYTIYDDGNKPISHKMTHPHLHFQSCSCCCCVLKFPGTFVHIHICQSFISLHTYYILCCFVPHFLPSSSLIAQQSRVTLKVQLKHSPGRRSWSFIHPFRPCSCWVPLTGKERLCGPTQIDSVLLIVDGKITGNKLKGGGGKRTQRKKWFILI